MRRPAEKNDKPIKDVLKDFGAQKKISSGFYNSKIMNIWKQKMGPAINNYTKDVRFVKGTLYINITSAPLKQELQMGRSKIVSLINKELQGDFVKNVVIR